MRIQVISLCALALSGGLVSGSAAATTEPGHAHDRIVVLSHFPLAGGSVGRLVAAGHYNRQYLYAEQNGKKLTVIDITDPTRPFRTAGISYPGNSGSGDLVAAEGTAALVVSPAAAHSPAPAETVRIMSFADPAHPRVSRGFDGVTALSRDNARGLIFLADGDGIWILQRRPAPDPAAAAAYARYLMYNH